MLLVFVHSRFALFFANLVTADYGNPVFIVRYTLESHFRHYYLVNLSDMMAQAFLCCWPVPVLWDEDIDPKKRTTLHQYWQ